MLLRSWLIVLCLGVLWTDALHAQEGEPARELFEEGVAHSDAGNWELAAARFEQSLALSDRPGTRVNLVHAYVALDRPLELVRHALAFLALPPEPHRAEARSEVEVALARARQKLALLGTESLPAGSVVRVDGTAPPVRDQRFVYLLAGLHRLEVEVPGAPVEVIELSLGAGQAVTWPRQGRVILAEPSQPAVPQVAAPIVSAPLSPAVQVDEPPPRWRRRLAIVSGTLGASVGVTATTMYLLSLKRADDVRKADPFAYGFLTKHDAYANVARSVTPLALSAAPLLAAAVALGPRTSRWGSRATALTALGIGTALLATGLVLAIQTPDKIGVTNIDEPSRPLGALIASTASPFLSYSISILVTLKGERNGPKLALFRAGSRP